MSFQCIGVYGLGLLGGSILKALRSRGGRISVYGFSRKPESLKIAKKSSLIDKGFLGLNHAKALAECDLLILAAPIRSIINAFDLIRRSSIKNLVVIDVGSTKGEIVKSADRMFKKSSISFVGCHPMAGSDKSGFLFSDENLFKGALCLLTPGKTSGATSVNKVARFWKHLGCRIKKLSPQTHDRIIARVSHFPHLVSAALVGSVDEKYFPYAATGFRDMTRIAGSSSGLWKEIVFSNTAAVNQAYKGFEKRLRQILQMVNEGDESRFARLFHESSTKRKRLV